MTAPGRAPSAPPVPTAEEFREECRRFLEARYPRRTDVARPFVWGEGSDAVGLFEETDPAEEARQLAAVKAWRRELWDAGLAWITGPAEFGGPRPAGVPPADLRPRGPRLRRRRATGC